MINKRILIILFVLNINIRHCSSLQSSIFQKTSQRTHFEVPRFGKTIILFGVEEESESPSFQNDEAEQVSDEATSWEYFVPKWYNKNAELRMEQMELIRMSWEGIKYHPPGLDKLVQDFYTHIWEEEPSLKKLFSLDMSKQHSKFTSAFSLLINLLDDPKRLREELKLLAQRHVGYGARTADYSIFVSSLLYSIEQSSPLLWNQFLLEAWMDLFSIVLETVLPVAWDLEQKNKMNADTQDKN